MLVAVDKLIIGSFLSTFKDYMSKGSTIFLHCESKIWATAQISSDYFFSESEIWTDKKYPHRFRIDGLRVLTQPIELTNGHYNVELRKRYGTGWAYSFLFSPKPIPNDIALELVSEAKSKALDGISDLSSLREVLGES